MVQVLLIKAFIGNWIYDRCELCKHTDFSQFNMNLYTKLSVISFSYSQMIASKFFSGNLIGTDIRLKLIYVFLQARFEIEDI